jgi:putative PIN family toxin of toxin-antitoxin system
MSASFPPLVTLDTNVLVSALLKRASKPGQVLDLALSGKIRVAFDARIRQEYQTVLARPKFNLTWSDTEAVLAALYITGLNITAAHLPLEAGEILDSDDLPFAEVAVAAQVKALVTGNARHFMFLNRLGIRVLSPAEFLQLISASD